MSTLVLTALATVAMVCGVYYLVSWWNVRQLRKRLRSPELAAVMRKLTDIIDSISTDRHDR